MTKEEWTRDCLPLYRELQPMFEKVRGEWRGGDRYYCPRQGETPGEDGVKYIWPFFTGDKVGGGYVFEPCCPDVSLWLPDIYSRDPERPERGLWGMVRCAMGIDLNAGNWRVLVGRVRDNHGMIGCFPEMDFEAETLELALLRALKWQREQEKGKR